MRLLLGCRVFEKMAAFNVRWLVLADGQSAQRGRDESVPVTSFLAP